MKWGRLPRRSSTISILLAFIIHHKVQQNGFMAGARAHGENDEMSCFFVSRSFTPSELNFFILSPEDPAIKHILTA